MNVQTNLTGLRKAAVVALMIGEDASAQIFKHMTEDEIETLLSEMAALGRVSAKMGEQVLDEFNQTALAAEHVARGDISFQETLAEEVVAPGVLTRYAPQIEEGGRIVALLVVVALMFVFVLRPLMQRLSVRPSQELALASGTASAGGARIRTIADMENEIGAQLDAAALNVSPDNLRLPVLTKRITESSQKEPEHVAKVLRSWMNDQAR